MIWQLLIRMFPSPFPIVPFPLSFHMAGMTFHFPDRFSFNANNLPADASDLGGILPIVISALPITVHPFDEMLFHLPIFCFRKLLLIGDPSFFERKGRNVAGIFVEPACCCFLFFFSR